MNRSPQISLNPDVISVETKNIRSAAGYPTLTSANEEQSNYLERNPIIVKQELCEAMKAMRIT